MRRRKARAASHVKRSNLKRTCPSGKSGFRYEGEAKAAIREGSRPDLLVYRCRDCKEFHLCDPVGRRERRRKAEGRIKR